MWNGLANCRLGSSYLICCHSHHLLLPYSLLDWFAWRILEAPLPYTPKELENPPFPPLPAMILHLFFLLFSSFGWSFGIVVSKVKSETDHNWSLVSMVEVEEPNPSSRAHLFLSVPRMGRFLKWLVSSAPRWLKIIYSALSYRASGKVIRGWIAFPNFLGERDFFLTCVPWRWLAPLYLIPHPTKAWMPAFP